MNHNLKPSRELLQEAPAFSPQTLVNPTAEGIQVIIPFAPQVSMVVVLSIEQLKMAMEQCVQMRLAGRRDLKVV